MNMAYGLFTFAYAGEGDAAGDMGSDEYVDVWVYDQDDVCYGCTRGGTWEEAMALARAYVDKVLHPVPVYYPRGEAY